MPPGQVAPGSARFLQEKFVTTCCSRHVFRACLHYQKISALGYLVSKTIAQHMSNIHISALRSSCCPDHSTISTQFSHCGNTSAHKARPRWLLTYARFLESTAQFIMCGAGSNFHGVVNHERTRSLQVAKSSRHEWMIHAIYIASIAIMSCEL